MSAAFATQSDVVYVKVWYPFSVEISNFIGALGMQVRRVIYVKRPEKW